MDAKADRNLGSPTTGIPIPRRKPVPSHDPAPISSKNEAPISKKPKAPPSWDIVPHTFLALTVIGAAAFNWPLRWILSGTPIFLYCILLGDSHGHRILPSIPIWSIFTALNLAYAISTSSWLLYWTFCGFSYPCILLCCLFQFDYAAGSARRMFRKLLCNLHFFNDKVAFFDLPGLEFDTETKGLMVIRGVTLSLSTLTCVAHGVEVAIRLTPDMELSIQVDKVTVSLFRNIEIDDIYANIRGGDWEMTFGDVPPAPRVWDEDDLLATDTPIIRAAALALDGGLPDASPTPNTVNEDTLEETLEGMDTRKAVESVGKISPLDNEASRRYEELIQNISDTSLIKRTIRQLKDTPTEEDEGGHSLDFGNPSDLRAAIAGHLQDQPAIAHPPSKTIRLSTIRHTSHPNVKKFLHRLPLLYRLLLNPISYLHPVTI